VATCCTQHPLSWSVEIGAAVRGRDHGSVVGGRRFDTPLAGRSSRSMTWRLLRNPIALLPHGVQHSRSVNDG
jgi:hypothetical protein